MRAIFVYESIDFKRGVSDREIRQSLSGIFRPGQIVASPTRPGKNPLIDIYAVMEQINNPVSKGLLIMGLGDIYGELRIFDPMMSNYDILMPPEQLRPLNDDEAKIVLAYMNDPLNSNWLVKKMRDFHLKVDKDINFFI